jgi:20S proteasome subunit beta 2
MELGPAFRSHMCKATRATSSPIQTTFNPLRQHQTIPSISRQQHNHLLKSVDKMPGFDFSNHNRNVALHARGVPLPKATSTGTTIVGCLYDGGVVIAADTRATSGPIVADKNCEKLHYISPQIWCAGAGTAADTEFTTALMSSNLELHALSTGRKPRVVTVMTMLKQHLFRYQGHIGAYLVVAGCDPTGAHLFTVHAHGSTDKLPYVTMGSGSLAAMSVFETTWKNDLTRDQAVKLCSEAIQAGIWNDLGSGSNVDVCVITEEKTELLRNYITPNVREQKMRDYKFARGTTAVLDQKIITKEEISKYVTVQDLGDGEAGVGEKMEVDT